MSTRKSPGPILLAVVLFIASATTLLVAATASCDGRLVYALDDPYIHMAMARNLGDHGTWGVTRYAFTSSSSSPLWTLLLAVIFGIFGALPGWPLVLNLLAGLAVIAVSAHAVAVLAPRATRGATLAILTAVVVFTPLAPLAFAGQEHLLHAALTLAFALQAARAIEEPEELPDGTRQRPEVLMAALAIPLVAVRYEGLFLVAAASLLMMSRGRRQIGWAVGIAALAPVIAYAMVSMAHGWFALPNPLLLKGNLADISRVRTMIGGILSLDFSAAAPEGWLQAGIDVARLFGLTAVEKLFATPHLLMLVISGVALAGGRAANALPDRGRAMLLLFLGTTFLHLQFARIGWFHRYEAYLVALGVVAIGCRLAARANSVDASHFIDISGAAARSGQRRVRRNLLAAVLLMPLLYRGMLAAYQVPRATSNVNEQQIQMGQFLEKYYRGAPVAVNDVGAVNWLADIQCVDFFGLADIEVCRKRMDLTWNREAIDVLSRQRAVRVAVLYERWFDQQSTDGLPESWQRVARWRILRNVVNGEDTVSFFAVRQNERRYLESSLREYRDQLPRTVIVTWDK